MVELVSTPVSGCTTKLMSATNVDQLNEMKHTHSPHMSDKALKYLNSLNNHEQYPAVRVNMGEGIFMYQQSASSSVESMNNEQCKQVG